MREVDMTEVEPSPMEGSMVGNGAIGEFNNPI
jgi:hypothetical protein